MILKPGKIASKKEIGTIRELTRAEMEILKAPRPKSPTIATLRDSHHRVARLFAMGLRTIQVHQKSGYSFGRLRALQDDPSFQNLIAGYRAMVDESWKAEIDDYYAAASKTKLVVMEMIADSVEEAQETGEKIPLKTLIALNADLADRTGHGKKTTNVNVNVDLGSRLERARVRSSKVIDGRVNLTPVQAPRLVEANQTAPRPPIAELKSKDRSDGPLPVIRRRVVA